LLHLCESHYALHFNKIPEKRQTKTAEKIQQFQEI
jgi:hypothetical protein